MSRFRSFLAPDIAVYIKYQKASNRWSETYEINLHLFDNYCHKTYPLKKFLTQEMIDGWCGQRATESNNSCRARISVVASFVLYLQSRGKTEVSPPDIPKSERCTYIPHAFTESELQNFFNACDNLPAKPKKPEVFLNKIIIPVFFRLLYSSGIRTKEARLLHVKDINFEQGILGIRESKGESQHFVVLHDSMLEILKEYDVAIRKIYPMRKYLFPASESAHLKKGWVLYHFRKIWDSCNTSYATAYDLRHNYATENINQWVGCGFDFDSKLVYLSKLALSRRFIEGMASGSVKG